MTREPFIAHSELTNEIYIVAGKEKYRVTEQAIKAVIAIKALEQEPIWIPVSEKLPEDSGEYLVSVIYEEDEEYKQVGVAWFAHPKDYDIKDGEWRELMINEKVIAWMPLPKAYREVEE